MTPFPLKRLLAFARSLWGRSSDDDRQRPVTARRETRVQFYLPGQLADTLATRAVENRSHEGAAAAERAADFDARPYAYRFCDVWTCEVDGRTMETEPFGYSPRHYPEGTVRSRVHVQRGVEAGRYPQAMLDQMDRRGHETVVQARTGQFKPYVPGEDLVI